MGAVICLFAFLLAGYFFLLRSTDRGLRRWSFRTAAGFKDDYFRKWWAKNYQRSHTSYTWVYFCWALFAFAGASAAGTALFGSTTVLGMPGIWLLWRLGWHAWDARIEECLKRGIRLGDASAPPANGPVAISRIHREQPECTTPPVILACWSEPPTVGVPLKDLPHRSPSQQAQPDDALRQVMQPALTTSNTGAAERFDAPSRGDDISSALVKQIGQPAEISVGWWVATGIGLAAVALALLLAANNAPEPTHVTMANAATAENSAPARDQSANHQDCILASRREAERLYPELLDQDSPLAREVRNQIVDLQARQDSILAKDNAPLIITERAVELLRARRSPTGTVISTSQIQAAREEDRPEDRAFLQRLDADFRALKGSRQTAASTPHAGQPKNVQIDFVRLVYSAQGTPRITHLGGYNPNGSLWCLPLDDAMSGVRRDAYQFYVLQGGRRKDVELVPDSGSATWGFHVVGDPTMQDQLCELPAFPR